MAIFFTQNTFKICVCKNYKVGVKNMSFIESLSRACSKLPEVLPKAEGELKNSLVKAAGKGGKLENSLVKVERSLFKGENSLVTVPNVEGGLKMMDPLNTDTLNLTPKPAVEKLSITTIPKAHMDAIKASVFGKNHTIIEKVRVKKFTPTEGNPKAFEWVDAYVGFSMGDTRNIGNGLLGVNTRTITIIAIDEKGAARGIGKIDFQRIDAKDAKDFYPGMETGIFYGLGLENFTQDELFYKGPKYGGIAEAAYNALAPILEKLGYKDILMRAVKDKAIGIQTTHVGFVPIKVNFKNPKTLANPKSMEDWYGLTLEEIKKRLNSLNTIYDHGLNLNEIPTSTAIAGGGEVGVMPL